MKTVLLTIAAFLLGIILVSVPIGVFGSSNIVWGEDNQYGVVHIPSTKVLHLPGKKMDVSYAVDIVGKGNETIDVPIPDLSLSVTPVGGPDDVKFTKSRGSSENANTDGQNSQRRVWKIDVPKDGDYRVVAGGEPTSGEINAEFWFGHGPPIPGYMVPILAAIISAIAIAGYFIRNRRRTARGALATD